MQPLDSDRIPIVGQECEQPESRDFYAETGFKHNPFASLEWLLVFEGDGLVAGHSHEEVLCQAPPAEREREGAGFRHVSSGSRLGFCAYG